MTVERTLEITLPGWWHVGSGRGIGGYADAAILRSPEGLPWIPGRTLRGLVREALEHAAAFGRLDADIAETLCGTAPPPDRPTEKTVRRRRFETDPGILRFGNARLPQAWRAWASDARNKATLDDLFGVFAQTAIYGRDGKAPGLARDHSLRTIEVAPPMTLQAGLQVDERAADGIDWERALEKALPLIRGLGASRHRGLGRARIALAGGDRGKATHAPLRPSDSAPVGDRVLLRIDLTDELILSTTSATTGAHQTLDFIPGAVLLGAAARRYAEFGEYAWAVFHAGGVRFGNAYPLIDRPGSPPVPTLPVPLAWHHAKGESGEGGAAGGTLGPAKVARILDAKIQNRAHTESDRKASTQSVQMRKGYVSRDGRLVSPATRYRQKTAIDRDRQGRVREGALFGYASLDAGQAFLAEIRFDPGLVPQPVRRQVIDALTGGPLLIGRSRSAEYGEARAAVCDDPSVAAALDGLVEPGRPKRAKGLAVLLLSDLALEDEQTGAPTTLPQPRHFGLPEGWALSRARSFVRTRRYAPFNGKRRLFDAERQVLEKGSVLVFEAPDGAELDEAALADVRRTIDAGIGQHRAEGLGKVVMEPWCLDGDKPEFPEQQPNAGSSPGAESMNAAMPDDPLFRWLMRRHDERVLPAEASKLAETSEALFATLYKEAWGEADRSGTPRQEAAPSNAQWGAVRDLVMDCATREDIRKALFHEPKKGERASAADGGLCTTGVSRKAWRNGSHRDPRTHEWRFVSFSDLLEELLDADELDKPLNEAGLQRAGADPDRLRDGLARLAILTLAHRMPRRLAEWEHRLRKASA